ncbi:F0F1 ATP synthase subunit epsilon [Hydrogenophaga sp. PAMC20947]|uniref:F0F1 ATP synthase subunit epsilon n=1 Tax=Hydrogenophaga sp. PAMC20947 TaxID=2565558 RepID=UPI001FF934E6|nr:F0F1 ATP synthase subunit epsilon [Hydrogenophaga sp. PAMC20947]
MLLPSQVYADEPDVLRIVAETSAGSMGVLPHRLDCVAALVPGILTYESAAGGEVFVALDQGVLVKAGAEVRVSARRAIGGTNLARLREAIAQEFAQIDAQEQALRSVMAQLDGGFMRRFAALTDD